LIFKQILTKKRVSQKHLKSYLQQKQELDNIAQILERSTKIKASLFLLFSLIDLAVSLVFVMAMVKKYYKLLEIMKSIDFLYEKHANYS